MMEISIIDDFDLQKIAHSGQCFRVREFEDGTFRFVTGREVLYIKELSAKHFEISCSDEVWSRTWVPYFDLERSYLHIRERIPDSDKYMQLAAREGQGIRILHQDPWETLVTFVVFQRKSIPAIKNSVELLAHMLIDPKLEASKDWYAFHPRGIYDKGPVKRFLMEHGIPHTKSGPLNITKAANINSAWAERRDSPDIANCVIDVVSYLESHNSFPEIQKIGVSLIEKLLREAIRIQELSVEVKPSTDPDYISDLCIKLIDNVPDSGNTPQQIASKLLTYYHLSMHSEIRVTGGDDRASVTSTTSNKPGDVNEEWCNKILKVYEITVKPFDGERIVDSYDCIEKFNQHSEQQIREVIVICRPKDCPTQIRTSGFSFYLGSIDHQNVRYYFWNIYEWVASMLQRMTDEGKELFLFSLNSYVNDVNTSEAVKREWRKIQGIE